MSNGRIPGPYSGTGGVLILGQRLKTFVCPQNHVDELPAPLSIDLPQPQGIVPDLIRIPVCRICVIAFFAENMPVREATADELEYIRRKKEEQGNAEKSA